MARMAFRRVRGRIIPIKISDHAKDLAAGGLAFAGATTAANKLRKKTAKKTTGKTSFGGLSNLTFELGASAGILGLLAKKGPKRVRTGINAFGRLVTGSFGMARRQGRK